MKLTLQGELKQSQPQSGSTQREEDYGGLSRASKCLTLEFQTQIDMIGIINSASFAVQCCLDGT